MPPEAQAKPGRPRDPNSRPSKLRNLNARESLSETTVVDTIEEVSPEKRRLSHLYQKAMTRIREDFPSRMWTSATVAESRRGGKVAVTITVSRIK